MASFTQAGLRVGMLAKATIPFDDGAFPIRLVFDTRDLNGAHLELSHHTRDDRFDREVTYRVRLVTTRPHFGGERWWFICPRTGSRVAKLFLPYGGWHFWSRAAYSLGFASQREARWERLQRKARKLHQALGGDPDDHWEVPPEKPKWMRWATYERKYAEWEAALERYELEFCSRASRLLRRLKRGHGG